MSLNICYFMSRKQKYKLYYKYSEKMSSARFYNNSYDNLGNLYNS